MSKAQEASLRLSVAEACQNPDWDITSIRQIKGHREVDDTDCPGKYFPLDELREYIRTYTPAVVDDPDPDVPVEEPAPAPAGLKLTRLLSYTCTVKTPLNFRIGPAAKGTPIKVFRKGDVLTVLGIRGDWVNVYHGGQTGYVAALYVTFNEMIKGDDVKALQEALKASGASPGTIDGVFGSKTAAAVKEAQDNAGITVDGIVGPKTTKKLGGVWDGK
jgi:hypothetical protein